jgi:two-component system sensor histidine kinase KdpD
MTSYCRQSRASDAYLKTRPARQTGNGVPLHVMGQQEQTPHHVDADLPITHEERALLWSVAHEIRAPLNSLTIAVDLMATEASALDPQAVRNLAQKIHGCARWLRGTLESLLSPVAIASGSLHIERVSLYLEEVIEDILPIVDPLLSARSQYLRIRLRGKALPVFADRQRIGQVIVNLVSNASKYSPCTSVIDLTIEPHGSWVRVITADRGPGLAPAERQRIFAPYFRTESARAADADGIGLGLALVKSIVKAHGGTVGVRNRVGGGARFWFDLPVHADNPASDFPVPIESRRVAKRRKFG